MTVIAPPPRRPRELDEIDRIEALIEEARRRARRRRWRNAAIVVLTAVGIYVGVNLRGGGGDGGGADRGVVPESPPPVASGRLDRAALASGRLTVIGVPLDAARATPVEHGWHQLSVLDGRGRLRPFLQCPDSRDYCGIVESLDWSPDGRRLAFTIGAHGVLNPYIGLHILDLRTGRDEHVIDSDVCTRVVRTDLAWSPDGSRLVYACDRAGSDRTRALALFEPGFGVRDLRTGLRGRISSPTWSPSGDRIAFAHAVAGVAPAILTVRLDGSNRRLVARNGSAPDWSPNGVIAYRSACGAVKLVTPDGRDITPIAGPFPCRSIGVAGTPVWSPDGRELAISNREGIYLVRADGSRLRRITTHTGIGLHGGRPSWRPGA